MSANLIPILYHNLDGMSNILSPFWSFPRGRNFIPNLKDWAFISIIPVISLYSLLFKYISGRYAYKKIKLKEYLKYLFLTQTTTQKFIKNETNSLDYPQKTLVFSRRMRYNNCWLLTGELPYQPYTLRSKYYITSTLKNA